MKQSKIILFILSCSILSSCAGYKYVQKTWTNAFDEMHREVAKNYPFTEWKKINLDSLYLVTSAEIERAEKSNNDTAYYLALRNYAFNFPDNHVFIAGNDFGLREKALSGHLGIFITELSDGKVIVSHICTPANKGKSVLNIGDEILTWNGIPIQKALKNTSIIWAERPEATHQNKRLKQCELLPFTPFGKQVEIVFRLPGKNETKETILNSFSSDEVQMPKQFPQENMVKRMFTSPVQMKIVQDKIAYIHIRNFMPNFDDINLSETFAEQLFFLQQFKVRNLILDFRGNQGGADKIAAKIAGYFFEDFEFYEAVEKYNPESGEFEIDKNQTLKIVPRKPYFDGEVLILVDQNTVSTGEGLPLVLQPLPNVQVMGQYSTSGSFAIGLADLIFKMPEKIAFGFLEGRSLDKYGNIQVDSDFTGVGGVHPDIVLPVSYESVLRTEIEGEDVVFEAAVEYFKNSISSPVSLIK